MFAVLIAVSMLAGCESNEMKMEALMGQWVISSAFEQDAETGTYRIEGERILRTIDGTTEDEYMRYQINGDTLTLIYAEYEEVFTRVN